MSSHSLKIAERAKLARKALGLTQAELANQSGLLLPTVKKIEQGTKPGTETLLGYAKLQISTNWLLLGVGSMRTNEAVHPSVPQQQGIVEFLGRASSLLSLAYRAALGGATDEVLRIATEAMPPMDAEEVDQNIAEIADAYRAANPAGKEAILLVARSVCADQD